MVDCKYENYFAYNKNFIGQWTFEKGEKLLTISNVKNEMVQNPNSKKDEEVITVYFKEMEQPLILNSTNNAIITELLESSDFNEWVDKQIYLGVDENVFFGKKKVGGVRVLNKLPKSSKTGKLASEDQIKAIQGLIDDGVINGKAMMEFYRVDALNGLTEEQATAILQMKAGNAAK